MLVVFTWIVLIKNPDRAVYFYKDEVAFIVFDVLFSTLQNVTQCCLSLACPTIYY